MMWLLTQKCINLYPVLTFSQMLQNRLDGASQWTSVSTLSVTADKSEGRKSQKQEATEGGCGGGLASHLQMTSTVPRLQAVID